MRVWGGKLIGEMKVKVYEAVATHAASTDHALYSEGFELEHIR